MTSSSSVSGASTAHSGARSASPRHSRQWIKHVSVDHASAPLPRTQARETRVAFATTSAARIGDARSAP
jgi:hypothetical protein